MLTRSKAYMFMKDHMHKHLTQISATVPRRWVGLGYFIRPRSCAWRICAFDDELHKKVTLDMGTKLTGAVGFLMGEFTGIRSRTT